MRVLLLLTALAVAAFSAAIDGKWVSEFEMRSRGANAAAEGRKVQVTFDLKSQGDQVTGTVSMGRGARSRGVEVQEGKLDGDKFSFTTMQKNQQGEVKIRWTGTVAGNELKGERTREGARRGVPFTAKRSN